MCVCADQSERYAREGAAGHSQSGVHMCTKLLPLLLHVALLSVCMLSWEREGEGVRKETLRNRLTGAEEEEESESAGNRSQKNRFLWQGGLVGRRICLSRSIERSIEGLHHVNKTITLD